MRNTRQDYIAQLSEIRRVIDKIEWDKTFVLQDTDLLQGEKGFVDAKLIYALDSGSMDDRFSIHMSIGDLVSMAENDGHEVCFQGFEDESSNAILWGGGDFVKYTAPVEQIVGNAYHEEVIKHPAEYSTLDFYDTLEEIEKMLGAYIHEDSGKEISAEEGIVLRHVKGMWNKVVSEMTINLGIDEAADILAELKTNGI